MADVSFSGDNPSFSFTCEGQAFADVRATWRTDEREPQAGVREVVYTHPDGLAVTAAYRSFERSDAVEIVLHLENRGDAPSALVADVLPLDVTLPLAVDARATLHHARGSLCLMDDFQPLQSDVRPGQPLVLEPRGGRSSNGTLPFMNLQLPEGGLVLAIGWSGQWRVSLTREGDRLRVTAGMAHTRFRLQPGESVRTPRILLVPWAGDEPAAGQNALRQLILRHYSPLDPDGQPCLPPLSHNTMMTYYRAGTTNEREMLQMLRRCAELGLEAFWIDACWYGTVGNSKAPEDGWAPNAGNWFYNRKNFPDGLARIGEAVAHEGMDFVVWFEPERVYRGSMIEREHPEYVLRLSDNPTGLFNLGDPAAHAYLTDLISGFISDAGITIYRQDFNMDPLAYWQAADADDRQGLAEMKYVAGLYELWDELRRRHPGLRIDNCSSGGRRIDLETVARSYPLWRSDFSDAGGPGHGMGLPIADQVVNGLAAWVPLQSGAVWSAEPYQWRSAMATGASLYGDIQGEGWPIPETKAALAEARRLRPLMLADYYRLSAVTTGAHDWSAHQFNDPHSGAGYALFFRRHESPFPTFEAQLRGLDAAATYEVITRESYAERSRETMSGAELAGLVVTITARPGSLLVEYRKYPR